MKKDFLKISKKLRHLILKATTEAKSGHPTSCLSAVDLMTVLFFGGFFKAKLDDPAFYNNDRLIFSKGHAVPLLYVLYTLCGVITEDELMRLRKFGSPLEGHPTMNFPYAEIATGSLGQGLSAGVGMALNAKYLDKLPYKTFVLLGDSEMAEGSNWEAMAIAAHYKLDNLIGIIDVNRLGQRGETMHGHDLDAYLRKVRAFGFDAVCIDGHNFKEIEEAFDSAMKNRNKPFMIIAKTFKGKGISFLENADNWHGKPLNTEELNRASLEIVGENNVFIPHLPLPEEVKVFDRKIKENVNQKNYSLDEKIATRRAYGNALVKFYPKYPNLVVLDAETGNSTYAEIFKKNYPEAFFEMFIAEQNMVGVALGLSRRGKIPFVSSFAAFLERAFDQIRMSSYSDGNIKFVGSHAGISIGPDGSSQMGLEDIAMFRAIQNCVIFYPADAISCEKQIELMLRHKGNCYLRLTRGETPIIYDQKENFEIGGFKILRESEKDVITVITAGITLFEALSAYEELKKDGVFIRVIDLYCLKPLNQKKLLKITEKIEKILVVEDHYAEGGIFEAIASELSTRKNLEIFSLAVKKMPRSGEPKELLDYAEISKEAIYRKIKSLL